MAEPFFGYSTIYGTDGEHWTPYMTRLWIGRLRLHIFHRGDADPDPHDHPWDFWTFPFHSYVEEVVEYVREQYQEDDFDFVHRRTRQIVPAWRLTYRPAEHCHRVIGRLDHVQTYDHGSGAIISPVLHTNDRRIVTLVWRGKSRRKWGFLKERLGRWCWTPWKRYVYEGGKTAPCE